MGDRRPVPTPFFRQSDQYITDRRSSTQVRLMECPNELEKFLPLGRGVSSLCPSRRFILACGSATVPPGHFLYLVNNPPSERELRQPLAFVRNECCLYILSVSMPFESASATVHLIQYSHKPISNLFCILITLISNDNQHTNLQFTVTGYLPFLFTLAATALATCCPYQLLSALSMTSPPTTHCH